MISLKDGSPASPWGVNASDNPDLQLSDYPSLDPYDIKNIPNVVTCGKINELKGGAETDPDGWTIFSPLANLLGQIGFIKLEEDLMGHSAGEMIPYGKYYTLSVIDTRNKLLEDRTLNLPIPKASGSTSETSNLDTLLVEVTTLLGNGGKSLYYPSLSRAYAYQPIQKDGMKDEFKTHHWFLPTAGELMRACYHVYKGVTAEDIGKEDAIFAKAISKGIMTNFGDNLYYRTSSENSKTSTQLVKPLASPSSVGGNKQGSYHLRYICAF